MSRHGRFGHVIGTRKMSLVRLLRSIHFTWFLTTWIINLAQLSVQRPCKLRLSADVHARLSKNSHYSILLVYIKTIHFTTSGCQVTYRVSSILICCLLFVACTCIFLHTFALELFAQVLSSDWSLLVLLYILKKSHNNNNNNNNDYLQEND